MEIQRSGFGLDRNDRWLLATRRRRKESANGGGRADKLANTAEFCNGVRGAIGAREEVLVLGSRLGEAPADLNEALATHWPIDAQVLRNKLERPCQGRPYYIRYAFKMGWTIEQVHQLTMIDPWFLDQMLQLCEFEAELIFNGRLCGRHYTTAKWVSEGSS